MSTPGGSHATEPGRESEGIGTAIAAIRRRWMIVVAIIVAAVAVAVVSYERKPKTYSATANVAFQAGTLSDSALQISPVGAGEPQREANTEVLIAHSPEVAEAVRQQLHSASSVQELLEDVTVEVAPSADVLNVEASTGDPAESAKLANAFAEQYIAFRAKSELEGIGTAQAKLRQQIATLPAGSEERLALEQSVQRLGELRAVAGGGANVIGRASPPSHPSGTGLITIAVIGLLVGVALSLALVFLLEMLDQRVKSVEEMERRYRLPALAAVPQSAFRPGPADGRTALLEPYRILRSALDFAAVTHRLDTVMITSAMSGEGKTTVAVDLAHAIALTGRRTVLVEVDLRRPTFRTHFGIESSDGLTAALLGDVSAESLLVQPMSDVPDLHVLPSGRLPYNPSELLASPRMTEIIEGLAELGGTVIIDAPPLNPVADAQALLSSPAIHGVLLIARVGQTTRENIARARSILDLHRAEPVGIVVTGLRDAGAYGYGSYRRSGGRHAPDEDFAAGTLSRPADRTSAGRHRV